MQIFKSAKKTVLGAMSVNDQAVEQAECPFHNTSPMKRAITDNDVWFPDRLNLRILQQKRANNPEDPNFDYAAAFSSLDLSTVKEDIKKCLTTSQDWWPADYGNYAPFMIRMSWHMAGTYRVYDGRGGANTGNQRFAPLNSWPDNGNLDKARRLLWPIKQKYGRKLSWADLFMLTGNVAHEMMGLPTFGFGGGREDIYAPEDDVYWGPESEMLDGSDRHEGAGNIEEPLAASEMGLIYVNPEGYENKPDPLDSAKEIRATFGMMAMSDYETVALIAGGHTFGKSHGAATMDNVGPEPEKAPIEQMGFGYKNSHGTGKGPDTITSGLEGAWTQNPTEWDYSYLENMFKYDWEVWKGPGGRHQWRPKIADDDAYTPDAHEEGKKHKLMMFTTDLSLKEDPEFAKISKHFLENPEEFKQAYARAWYKLIHRDMGPVTRLLGPEVPEAQPWQDPIPECNHELIDEGDIENLKKEILSTVKGSTSLTPECLIRTAWASASTFRCTDYRGGGNGARIRLSPQKNWECNSPEELQTVLQVLEKIQSQFNEANMEKKVSLADLIVLGGNAAVEDAAERGGFDGVKIPFHPGRMDASQEQTDVEQFEFLKPKYDGFRNYREPTAKSSLKEEEALVDKAHMLSLTAPEMTVLVGGLRALNVPLSDCGVLTGNPGALTNDFFINILDMGIEWSKLKDDDRLFVGKETSTGRTKWTASRSDLIFGSNSELRAISEYYATDDAKGIFVQDFCKAWNKVMELDRFDLKRTVN